MRVPSWRSTVRRPAPATPSPSLSITRAASCSSSRARPSGPAAFAQHSPDQYLLPVDADGFLDVGQEASVPVRVLACGLDQKLPR